MSDVAVSFLVLLLSIGSTYAFCIRPMRKGRCGMGSTPDGAARAARQPKRQRISP